jgi:hypothetical protein
MRSLVLSTMIPALTLGLRSRNLLENLDIADSSNCTWTAWSECKLESDTRCARVRTLEVLPLEKQAKDISGKIACHGNAGTVETKTCTDGLCPKWNIGNWTDCSGTCNATMRPWEGYQRRDITCEDVAGILYRESVCRNVHGKDTMPEEERPCECSHKLKPLELFVPKYRPIDV